LSAAVLGAGLAALGIVVPVSSATPAAAAPTSDPPTAARYGAAWISGQLSTRGWLPSPTDATKPDLNTTVFGALALASTATGGAAAGAALDFVASHLDEYVQVGGADAPGPLATLILAATATGRDPRASFGTDLVSRLQATRQASGLFGAADAQYDGAYRQGLALAALGAAGVKDAAGVDWLQAQQCADGGWVALRKDTSAPCPASDPANFTGEDSNSTAMAVMGLVAQGATAAHDAAAWFDATQGADGGWAYVAAPDQGSDANSTALAVMALKALGLDARSARFTTARDPVALLLSFQLGCEGGADAGAVAYQPVRGDLTANALATVQAVPALAGATLPLAGSTSLSSAPAAAVPCAAPAPAAASGGSPAPTAARASATPLADTGASGTLVLLAVGGALLVAVGAAAVHTANRSNSA
jgi:hypothetical protein